MWVYTTIGLFAIIVMIIICAILQKYDDYDTKKTSADVDYILNEYAPKILEFYNNKENYWKQTWDTKIECDIRVLRTAFSRLESILSINELSIKDMGERIKDINTKLDCFISQLGYDVESREELFKRKKLEEEAEKKKKYKDTPEYVFTKKKDKK